MSPLDPFSAILPTLFVIGVSVVREGFEDYSRYKMDKLLNNSRTAFYKNREWFETPWSSLRVGDVVRVKNRNVVPADMIVLRTSSRSGGCYIETASLDGEKNLKLKMGVNDLIRHVNGLANLDELKVRVSCLKPNADIHSFEGMVSWDDASFMLNHKQLLLRGSQLRNTDWAEGVVVYTGHDTKICKNTEQAKYKSSNLEKKLNTEILFMLLFQAMLYVSLGLCNFIWNQKYLTDHGAYIELKFGNVFEGFINMCAYFLLLNTMLPISLVVTLEVVKAFQCFHIYWDTDLYSRAKQRGCKIMSTTIHEELGQIEYLFTDKTGTLTANIMELKYLVIGDSEYFGTVDRDTALKNFQSKYINEGEFYSERLHDILTNKQNNGTKVSEPELVLFSED